MPLKLGLLDVNPNISAAYSGANLVYSSIPQYYLNLSKDNNDKLTGSGIIGTHVDLVGQDYEYGYESFEPIVFTTSGTVDLVGSSFGSGKIGLFFVGKGISAKHDSSIYAFNYNVKTVYVYKIEVSYSNANKELNLIINGVLVETLTSVPSITSNGNAIFGVNRGTSSGVKMDLKCKSFFINDIIWKCNENGGFDLTSETGGVTVLGETDLNLAYWNSNVWKEAINPQVPQVNNIYLLTGQSNMDGTGVVADAQAKYKGVIPNSFVWWNGVWQPLEAGVNGSVSDLFNPMYSLAKELYDYNPNVKNYFVIKALSGSGMYDSWGVGLLLYNSAISAFNSAVVTDVFRNKCIIFQQGEADTKDIINANNYELAEEGMITGIKNETGISFFIDGKLGDITKPDLLYPNIVNQAKDNNLTNNVSDATIDTTGLVLPDGVHFDTAGYEEVGVRYFNVVKDL